jgi:hypothetical protein
MGMCSSPMLQWSVPHFNHCWTPSPLQAHWERWCHTCLLWPACLFTVHMGEFPFPPRWSFPHNNHCYKLSSPQVCWAGVPLLPSLASLFIYSSHGECPSPSLLSSGHPVLFAMCLFFFSCLFFSFFFLFSLGGGQSVQEAMLICPREYCMPLICSPGGLPSRVGAGVWQRRSPPGFSI